MASQTDPGPGDDASTVQHRDAGTVQRHEAGAGPHAAAGAIQRQDLIDFVVREARLLDARRFEEWNALFTDDGIYWVPLVPNQEDGINHTSHMYEDKLLRDLRVQRFRSPRAFSQRPPSRCHHLLQTPTVEEFDPAGNRFVVRTEFHYTESQGDERQFHVGTCFHHLVVRDGALRMTLKRVDLLDCDTALAAVQLFI